MHWVSERYFSSRGLDGVILKASSQNLWLLCIPTNGLPAVMASPRELRKRNEDFLVMPGSSFEFIFRLPCAYNKKNTNK